MTTPDEAGKILATVEDAARRTRANRATRALPLLVLGLVILGAMPFYLLAPPTGDEGSQTNQLFGSLGGEVGTAAGAWTAIYWIIALPAAYAFIGWWYQRAAQRSGVGVNVKPLIITGVVLFAFLLLTLTTSPAFLPGTFPTFLPRDLVIRGLTPILTMAIGLFVWAIAERSARLLTVALVFLASALTASLYDVDNLTYRLGWEPSPETSLLPNLMLCAAVLLISSAVYAVAERRTRAHR